ncbi:MAG: ABC transporter substrate-binding protein, partial [Anaerolineae bacterium]|nr:ABC transporter substrate-binding protein [Anaerolineae bacterium]
TTRERAFTIEALQALGTRDTVYTNKDGEAATYTGVSIAALLDEVGVTETAAILLFVASDGYQAQVPLQDVQACADCIIGFQPQGGFRAVLPEFPGNVQVRDLVTIQVLGAAETMPQAPETSEEAIPNDGPVTITDGAGRTVTLERLPRRIVVVGRAPYIGLHLLYMFPEGRTRLIGAESRSATPSDFLPYVEPDFLDRIAIMAANPNPEQITALEPDLVLMKSVVMEQMGEALAQVGIPVVYLGLETPEQFFLDVTNLGLLLGNTSRAEEILAFYQTRLERIATRIADVSEEERPRVLLLEYSDRGGEVAVQVPAMAWMQTIQAQTAGGNPVWGSEAQITDGWTVVNFEQIAAWDPDKIFVVVWYQLDPQQVIAGLKADTQWSKLMAVRNGELYAFPADIFGWDTPESRWILGMTWLASRLYPERFADVDLQAEIYDFFAVLYGMDRSAVNAAIMPRVMLDVR